MRSLIMRMGAVFLTALFAVGLLSTPAHAEPATLSGTITSDATGEPIAGCVSVYDTDWNWATSTCSDETGSWSVEVEGGIAYKIEVSAYDGRHLGEWAQDAPYFWDAPAFTAPATVDVGLQVGAVIAGTLTRADGTPAEGASVNLEHEDFGTAGWASVSDTGEWQALVPPGTYTVLFQDWPASQWAYGQSTQEAATRFEAVAGGTTRVDDVLLGTAKVVGSVISDATNEPVEGACVSIFRPHPDQQWVDSIGEGCSGPDGAYEVEVAEAGTFAALVTDPQGRFVAEFSGNTTVQNQAATFDLSREEPTTFNASLAAGSILTGRALDAKSGAPITDACPTAHLGRTGGRIHGQVTECSSSDGQWRIKGLPAGDLAVEMNAYADPKVYAQTWAFKATSQATATLITVGAATTKSVRDIQMMPGGSVTGVISGPTGEPVADAWVRLDYGYPGRVGPGEGPHTAQTDANGRYTIHGVPSGDHTAFVYTWSEDRLAPEWSGDALTRSDATSFSVKALKSTTFNAQLAPGSMVSGVVVDSAGDPVNRNMIGLIYDADGNYIGDFDVYGGDNDFRSNPLPAGSFTLMLQDDETREEYWFEGITSDSGQTALTLGEGEHKEITFRLP